MASPKAPGPPMPPITDPNKVVEVFADDFVVQIRNGVVHVLFYGYRPRDLGTDGKVTDERVVVARVAFTVPAGIGFADCIKNLVTAMKTHETLMQVGAKVPN